MPLPIKPAPTFDRSFLIDLSDGMTYKQAERLFESGAVSRAIWESPILIGAVKGVEATYTPKLNLRSTVFAENICNCDVGRKRKICAHAIASALHFEALKHEAKNASMPHSDVAAAIDAEKTAIAVQPKKPKLRSIKTASVGDKLRMLVFLPPNLEAGIERDAIMVKVDAAAGREILPLNKLSPTRAFVVSDAQFAGLALIESWCGGKLANLLQLTGARLRRLLDLLVDEPVIYWIKKPNAPLSWENRKLPGIYEHLPEAEKQEEAMEADSSQPVAVEETSTVRSVPRGVSLRKPSKINPRRVAEAKAQDNWKYRAGDFPVAKASAESMDSYPQNRVIVDGSPNFIAIRLPAGGASESIQPLRRILKTEGFMLEPSNRKWWLRDRHKTLNFLAAHWGALKEEWRAIFTKSFDEKMAKVSISSLNIETKEEDGQFHLEVSLVNEGDESDLRRSLASGKSYHEGEGGGIALMDTASVEKLHSLEKAVSGQADRPFTSKFTKRLNVQELIDVEDLLEELSEGWQPPQAWQSRSKALKQIGALEPAPIRAEFDQILRTYQRIGVAWLWHLYRNELGGILADEMGLGKTLQALALIECIRQATPDGQPALVVCPASLVENWAREAARFTPNLKIVKQHGVARAKEPVELEDFDVVITSYGTMRQDVEMLSTIDWSVIIGDEAQHIKNRRTQNARSLTSLRSQGRFLLTGTPIENSLDDLLSLFAFLMPGYLTAPTGKLSQEDKNWHSKRQAERAAAYILRRTKKEVAPELPDKIEKTFFCEMGSRQQSFYQQTLEKTRRDIFNMEMAGANAGKVRFAAFTELLRLRQTCVDPRILDETFPESESAKLGAFDEILDECLDNGSRILVFSSFVTALKLLAEHLEEAGHEYCYLDGQTRNRQEVCDTFNGNASIPVFLISLKAGGTGLNLTGADTVVHFDPWWNPAAEAQATDRAHRIGQKKVVTSIKLIAANTVEEKVLELQAKKAEILKELFEESEAVNSKVSLDDIKGLLN